MPIPVRLDVPVDPGPETPDIPAIERWRRSEITWTSGNGGSVLLTGDISGWNAGVVVQPGIKGFDAPPYDLQLEEFPSLDGSYYRGVRAQHRELMIPLFMWAPDRRRLLEIKRRVLNLFNPKKGLGTLRVTEGDGSSRTIRCYYASGLEGDEQDAGQFTYCKFGVVLQAPDPFWYGDNISLVFDRSTPNTVNFYDGRGVRNGEPVITPEPFLGMHISTDVPSQSSIQISISGDEDTWPLWTIKDYKGAGVTLNNETTGESFHLSYEADNTTNGKVIRVDTRPGKKWVYEGVMNGVEFTRETNLWPHLEARDLWPIPEGESSARIQIHAIPGSEPKGTVALDYMPKFLGA
ncbi:phage tail domain-containing protein [Nocardiopsis sp. NPDC049922]|uniref:phage tail domain-containing protein n=1 Tax=Nocardiopsis sp. NPDC049922 TaxID=3155157 RepID=UPI0033E049BC